jgi:hypothetical protein
MRETCCDASVSFLEEVQGMQRVEAKHGCSKSERGGYGTRLHCRLLTYRRRVTEA